MLRTWLINEMALALSGKQIPNTNEKIIVFPTVDGRLIIQINEAVLTFDLNIFTKE